ncbi:DUF4260 domain-containing protein [Aquimarina sp. ERC-38]|uniref:DUF4260 domain-containing protein n=1 Tax=Aquimarina sp. ERC-38 TaxID=2949996 RepID=UPI0022461C70|nr:DUF4260 domain-containing protein [Aquimarina sp. ERC-38]UZO81561.1 DUF4260 domain-containing protein [Aquimarina sp. ERC-38]
MKKIIQLEEIAMMLLGIYAFTFLSYPWWLFVLLFLAPDIGMIGYLINPKIGAGVYNLFHHKGIAVLLFVSGVFFSIEFLQLAGCILFAHASFDRIVGYGLKYQDSFHHTHLGTIGNKK